MNQPDLSKFIVQEWDKFTNNRTRSTAGGLPFHIGPDPVFHQGFIRAKYHETADSALLVLHAHVQSPDWFHFDAGQMIVHADGRNFVLQPGEYHSELNHAEYGESGTEIVPGYCEERVSYAISPEDFFAICCAQSVDIRITGTSYKHEFRVEPSQLLLFRQFYHLVFNSSAFPGCLNHAAQTMTPQASAYVDKSLAEGNMILGALALGAILFLGLVAWIIIA